MEVRGTFSYQFPWTSEKNTVEESCTQNETGWLISYQLTAVCITDIFCLCFYTCNTHCVRHLDSLISTVTRHSTTKLTWSDCIDFSNTKTHVMSDLGGLKRFFNQGLYLTIVEEKVTWVNSRCLDASTSVRTHFRASDVLGSVMACSLWRRPGAQTLPDCERKERR